MSASSPKASPRRVDREQGVLADRCTPCDPEAALDDEVERIRRIVLMKNDFATPEGSAACNSEHTAQVLGRYSVEELPLHARILELNVCD